MRRISVNAPPQTRSLFVQAVGLDELRVDRERQRRHVPAERVVVDRAAVADQDQHRGGLAHDPGNGEKDPLMIPDIAVGSTTLRIVTTSAPQAHRGLPQLVRDQPEHLLGPADHHRKHQQDEGQGDGEGALLEAEPLIQRAKMNSAATIEGTPERMSTMKVVTRPADPRPYSTR